VENGSHANAKPASTSAGFAVPGEACEDCGLSSIRATKRRLKAITLIITMGNVNLGSISNFGPGTLAGCGFVEYEELATPAIALYETGSMIDDPATRLPHSSRMYRWSRLCVMPPKRFPSQNT
jgi:hypothetical protein